MKWHKRREWNDIRRWFAWYPVRLSNEPFSPYVWLEWIYRKKDCDRYAVVAWHSSDKQWLKDNLE